MTIDVGSERFVRDEQRKELWENEFVFCNY